jgi:hypothetical protein
MTSLSKNPVPKKRGRPLGSKNKRVRTVAGKKYTFKDKAFKQPNNHASEINKLQNRILELEMIRERLHSVIDRQEHKAIQYQAVIDYLETKLEIN